MPERKIVGTIMQGGKFYRAGDEDAFAAVMAPLPRRNLARLAEKGVIEGDWDLGAPADAPEPPANGVEGGEENDAPATKRAAKKTTKRKK